MMMNLNFLTRGLAKNAGNSSIQMLAVSQSGSRCLLSRNALIWQSQRGYMPFFGKKHAKHF